MSESDKNSIKLQEDEQQHQPLKVEVLPNNRSYDNYNDGDNDNEDEDAEDEQMEQEQEMPEDNNNELSQQNIQNNTNNKKRSHKKLEISNFIMKTYKILEDKKNANIVEWTEEENCFIVKDKERFSKEILPKYFKHSKFSSFVRQLNMYDFHKIRKEKEIPIFKHRFFQEGRIDLLHKIKRKSGEDVKEEDIGSKEALIISEGNIESRIQISTQQLKQSLQVIPSTKHEIEMLKKQNSELNHSINQINQQIQFLQVNKQKKKEKLMKILTSIMFFDLNSNTNINTISNQSQSQNPEATLETSSAIQPEENKETVNLMESLRSLQEHFVKDEEPYSFTEYRKRLSLVYAGLKSNLII